MAELVFSSIPRRFHPKRIHPATKTFQAIRIALNDELQNIKKCLGDGVNALAVGGRFCVISYHSLEDRMVKRMFKACDDRVAPVLLHFLNVFVGLSLS